MADLPKKKLNSRKYQWLGKRISEAQMERLFRLKMDNNQPITLMVSEAVDMYLDYEEKLSQMLRERDGSEGKKNAIS